MFTLVLGTIHRAVASGGDWGSAGGSKGNHSRAVFLSIAGPQRRFAQAGTGLDSGALQTHPRGSQCTVYPTGGAEAAPQGHTVYCSFRSFFKGRA